MSQFKLGESVFADKVLGCWMGKNCGGTLGAPLEKGYGEEEPYDVWWYPELREGGIPNDDLEMQLIWLKALEEVGPNLKAADLAQYWLDHIGYNWDEYGLSKTNLRLGLLPPVSGYFNNWFKHSMGCPIRSEIWACVAPGAPRIAVRLAYEDAICDHAGGESVYGEMFNTAIESAAFVVSDMETLLDIGRSYVADGSETARAVDAARAAYREGVDWRIARRRVMDATPNYNAQYSPINMAFQAIGLLYGKDFGEGICTAVNCGYDTDCTGATVGSILGILSGASGLPAKWTEPLGSVIATNESWGGLISASTCSNPVPTNLDDLTARTIAQASRVAAAFAEIGAAKSLEELYADDDVKKLWNLPANVVSFSSPAIDVQIDYVDTAAVSAGKEKKVVTTVKNRRAVAVRGDFSLVLPQGWLSNPGVGDVEIAPGASLSLTWIITAPTRSLIRNTNRASLSVDLVQRSVERDYPIVLIGAKSLRISDRYTSESSNPLDQAFEPEAASGDIYTETSRPGKWSVVSAPDNELPLADYLSEPGVVYIQAIVKSEQEREARLGVPSTLPTKLWLNNEPVLTLPNPRRLRPNYDGDGESYVNVKLQAGWNELFIKFAKTSEPLAVAHLILADPTSHNASLVDVEWTRFPWDD
jgi:ADP-ribosylglycohydrolase